MARYIDADKLLKEFDVDTSKDVMDISDIVFGVVTSIIERQPTADVVEVVRCKDCKHLTVHNSPTLYAYCEKNHYRFEPFQTDTRTHFCSYGVRENENSN